MRSRERQRAVDPVSRIPPMREKSGSLLAETIFVDAQPDGAGEPAAGAGPFHRGVSRDAGVDVAKPGRRQGLCRVRRRVGASVPRLGTACFANGAIFSDRLTGVGSLMADAVRFKFIQSPLSKAQLAPLGQIPTVTS